MQIRTSDLNTDLRKCRPPLRSVFFWGPYFLRSAFLSEFRIVWGSYFVFHIFSLRTFTPTSIIHSFGGSVQYFFCVLALQWNLIKTSPFCLIIQFFFFCSRDKKSNCFKQGWLRVFSGTIFVIKNVVFKTQNKHGNQGFKILPKISRTQCFFVEAFKSVFVHCRVFDARKREKNILIPIFFH